MLAMPLMGWYAARARRGGPAPRRAVRAMYMVAVRED